MMTEILQDATPFSETFLSPPQQDYCLRLLGIDSGKQADSFLESIPFSLHDTTAGTESELQAAVMGDRSTVDLALAIEHSNYFTNTVRRALAEDTPRRALTSLERFLEANPDRVWENSWVRFSQQALSPLANQVFEADLLADKSRPALGIRSDAERFRGKGTAGLGMVRVPISYLLKLSLADALGKQEALPQLLGDTGFRLLEHFQSDNSSPETYSFFVVPLRSETGTGEAVGKETSIRFLLTQLLIQYANQAFSLESSGQKAIICFSPHPPIRLKQLNECISDSFYRELFTSPCLSGWDQGEVKQQYMILCHEVLSRSQLAAVAKLRDAGIIANNLVVLPNVSSISLANNGTHISLGSRKLTLLLKDPSSGFTQIHEKYLGDLAIKAVEHFLPLFVGTYSAAPYRLDFCDFHPEKALGFLPHELDFTHLRMIWRRWKKKARLSFLGHSLTPTGPKWLDQFLSRLLQLPGDYLPDFRLIDYLVALLSTDQSPALDGTLDNSNRLKKDLSDLGIFDTKMSLYLLYRQREFHKMGFSGFEGRHYSLFESLLNDLGRATDLQTLVTALAFKYMAQDALRREHIPDDPSTESERRQIIFGTAIGIPTFFVRKNSQNLFLRRILQKTEAVRPSHRYPGYLRVQNRDYRLALLRILQEDGSDLIEMFQLKDTLEDLRNRLEDPAGFAVADRLTRSILGVSNLRSPLQIRAAEFNQAAERYYREDLKRHHLLEALELMEEALGELTKQAQADIHWRSVWRYVMGDMDPWAFLHGMKKDLLEEQAKSGDLIKMIDLVLLNVQLETQQAAAFLQEEPHNALECASVCG